MKTSRPAASKGRRGWRRRIIRWAALVIGVLLLAELTALAYLRFLPPLTTSVQVERRIQALFARKPYHKQYEWVPLRAISPDLQHAVIAAEDARFYTHHGIDWKEVSVVAEEGLDEGRVSRGASSISQQLVKNLFLTTWRSGFRKGLEFALVYPAELMLGKQRILELYLNVIEWGPGIYGAEAAARHYYHVPAAKISREEAARLAAIIPAPARRRPGRMGNYADDILTRMRQMGW